MARKPTFPADELVAYCVEHGRAETLRKFGCGRATLDNALHLHDVVVPTLSAIRRVQHLKWIEEHDPTLLEATQHLNCSIHYIKQICKSAGVSLRTPESSSPVSMSNFDILRMLLCGHTQSEVAEEQYVSRQRVSQVYKIAERAGLLGDSSFVQVKPDTPVERTHDNRAIYRPLSEVCDAS